MRLPVLHFMNLGVSIGCILALLVLIAGEHLTADDREPQAESTGESGISQPLDRTPEDVNEQPPPPAFQLSQDVRSVLTPLFSSIAEAEVSRATVEMLTDSLMQGRVLDSQKSTYQIASNAPDKFTIYLKESERRTRIYCDGETTTIAVAPDAYVDLHESIENQQAVYELPVPMGTYPEPLLALTLAGVDPALSLISGMQSIDIIDENDFLGKVPAVHLRGVQLDSVTWDLWISKADPPQPLRLLVDITPLLIASSQVHVPTGYSQQLRFDFLAWRVLGEVSEELFAFSPPPGSKKYDSLQDYYGSQSGAAAEHPLVGKLAPLFRARTLDGEIFTSKSTAGKVLIIEFWASWCEPCIASMPVVKAVADEYDKDDVLLIALNTGEQEEEIRSFLDEQKLEGLNIVLDPEGKIADGFKVEALPLTVIVGKSGEIESVHVGFVGEDAVRRRLTDELDVLCVGGRIATAEASTNEGDGRDPDDADD